MNNVVDTVPWSLIVIFTGCFLASRCVRLTERIVRRVRVEMGEGDWPLVRLDVPARLLPRLFVVWLVGHTVWFALSLPLTLESPVGIGPAVSALLLLASMAALGMLAWIDAETGILPNELILLVIPLVFLYHGLLTGEVLPATTFLWGMTLGYAVPILFIGIYLVFTGREALGQGDAKLLAVIGLWLGAAPLIDVWLIACGLLLVYTATKRCRDKRKLSLKSSVPFGPFLVAAANIVFICGPV